MKTLDDYYKEYSVDCVYDKDNLDASSNNIEYVANKYAIYIAIEGKTWKLLLEKKKKISSQLEDYFLGKIDGKDIGREPWQIMETKESSRKRIEADKEMTELNIKIIDAEIKVDYLKEVLFFLKQRSFNIGHAIDHRKFMGGM